MALSGNSLLFAIAIVVCGIIIYQKLNAHLSPLKKDDFKHSDFKLAPIPTTYYSAGKISEVLPDWHHAFHLYRLHANETFQFDISKANSKVRAKALLKECPWHSSVCRPCFDSSRKVTEVDTDTIFNEPGWYASFAKISDSAVAILWNLMKFPFEVKTTQLEHAFISNLDRPMVTAGIHANPMTSSMAVQFVGRKTWLFFSSKTYLGQMGAIPTAPILLPRHAPNSPYEFFVYTSEPGDVLFFPESWAHIVLTHDGPNVMVNYRKFNIMNVVRQPFTWIAATINNFRSPLIHEAGRVAGNDLQQQSVPEKHINVISYLEMDKLCENGLTEFDKDMMKVLADEYKKYGSKSV